MSTRKKISFADSPTNMYLANHTITREEYYRRMENSDTPYDYHGIERHDRNIRPAP